MPIAEYLRRQGYYIYVAIQQTSDPSKSLQALTDRDSQDGTRA